MTIRIVHGNAVYRLYERHMTSCGTDGNQLALRAAPKLYNAEFIIISTFRAQVKIGIFPFGFNPLGRIIFLVTLRKVMEFIMFCQNVQVQKGLKKKTSI